MSFTKGSVRMSENVLSHKRGYHCDTGRYFGVHIWDEYSLRGSLHLRQPTLPVYLFKVVTWILSEKSSCLKDMPRAKGRDFFHSFTRGKIKPEKCKVSGVTILAILLCTETPYLLNITHS